MMHNQEPLLLMFSIKDERTYCDPTFMARVLNGVEERKIHKPSTEEWAAWDRRRLVDQSDVTVLTNQWTLPNDWRRRIYADVCENVSVCHSQFPRPAANA